MGSPVMLRKNSLELAGDDICSKDRDEFCSNERSEFCSNDRDEVLQKEGKQEGKEMKQGKSLTRVDESKIVENDQRAKKSEHKAELSNSSKDPEFYYHHCMC